MNNHGNQHGTIHALDLDVQRKLSELGTLQMMILLASVVGLQPNVKWLELSLHGSPPEKKLLPLGWDELLPYVHTRVSGSSVDLSFEHTQCLV